MHPAWTVHEIVGEIASYLGVPSLLRLAITCRTLYPPCEEALWALQGSLKPLMEFLPPDLVRLESLDRVCGVPAAAAAIHDTPGAQVQALRRLPVESDFEKFSPRARRMRYLRCSCSLDRLELLALKELQNHIDLVAMFANLEHIKIISHGGGDIFNAPSGLLSRPSHISIQHMVPIREPRRTSDFPNSSPFFGDDMCSVLKDLEDNAGNGRLEALSFLADVQIFTRRFSQRFKSVLLKNSSSLKTVELSEFPGINIFYALMRMPHIDSVVLGRILTREVWVPGREPHPRGGPPLVAPHLRSLKLIGQAIGVWQLSILKHWEYPELRELFFLELGYSIKPTELIKAVTEVAPGVRRLEIESAVDHSVTQLYDMNTLRPLLHLCPHLEHFHIRLHDHSSIALGDGDVDDMSRAWPNLRYLHLDPRMSPNSKVTLEGLLPFARNCPNLEELHLGLHAAITHFVYDRAMYQLDSTDSDGATPTPSKLRVLGIGAPLVHGTQMCAEFLRFLFPSIIDISVPASHGVHSRRKFAWDVVAWRVLHQRPVIYPDTSDEAVTESLLCQDDDYYEWNSDWDDEETEGNDSEWDEAKLEAELNKDA